MLTGARLGHDPRLAHPLRQQTLAQGVVDLVGSGVREILSLEEDADVGPGAVGKGGGSDLEQRRRAADEVALQPGQLLPVRGVAPRLGPCGAQLVERRDERLRDVAPTVRAEPAARVDTVGAGRLASRGAHEGRDAPRIGFVVALQAGCRVDQGGSSGSHRRRPRSPGRAHLQCRPARFG